MAGTNAGKDKYAMLHEDLLRHIDRIRLCRGNLGPVPCMISALAAFATCLSLSAWDLVFAKRLQIVAFLSSTLNSLKISF